jgi:hypothetical protein
MYFHDVNVGVARAQELALPDGSPRDVDREFALMFTVAHEQQTFYAMDNIRDFLPSYYASAEPETLQESLDEDDDDSDDGYSDLYPSINGATRAAPTALSGLRNACEAGRAVRAP